MSNNVMDYKRRIKESLFYAAGAKCCICGFDETYPGLYDFHHVDPLKKEFGLNATVASIEKNIKEAQKCILVCPICHRKIHYNIITDIPSPSVDVDLFWKHYDILSPQGKHQREIMQNKKPTREELKELIRKQTFTSIAKKYNVSIAAIKKWCIKFNLPYQKKVIKTISDADWLSI